MQSPSERTSTLLLERPRREVWAGPAEVTDVAPRRDAGIAPDEDRTAGPASEHEPVLASPGMALFAAFSILEGYRWIGAIPSGNSRLSTLASGGAGAVAFAVLATAAVMLLTRGGRRRRPLPQRLARLATAAVVASSVALVVSTGTAAKDAVGVSDLLLASALAGVLIAGERRRRAGRAGISPAKGGSAHGTLPVA
jgi:hypothetical protein